jgi:hypothetical protein
MLARLARSALFFATMLVVSTLARSALASRSAAPFCDDRGATALAAPPDLQASGEAIQRARAEACGMKVNGDTWRSILRPARASVRATPSQPSPARLTAPLATVPLVSVVAPAPETLSDPPAGASGRVERPPRH